jgi:tRNA(Ile)-lysidine synthase
MPQPLEQRVLASIRDQRMMGAGDRVAAAVSGGADSVALLGILARLRGKLGITLSVAHFDHGLRGLESDRDAAFVADLARAHGLELFSERADVAAEARRNRWNTEDAARRLRYAFFRRIVEQGKATRVAVAHTADDQAETVLAHLIRGTGPTGLAGIYPLALPIVRPLLAVRRRALRDYLTRLGQNWREDSTNQDPHRLRSRIRAQLVPQLEQNFSDRIVEHLCALGRLSREEQTFWDALVEDCYRALVHSGPIPGRGEALSISVVDLLHPFRPDAGHGGGSTRPNRKSADDWRALTERLIRRLYQQSKGDRCQLTARHVEQVIRLAGKSTSGKKVRLPGAIQVERTFHHLVFSANSPAAAEKEKETDSGRIAYQYPVSLCKTETTRVPVRELGICFRLKMVDWRKLGSETTGESQVLDVDSLSAPLILRNWLPGDAYTPYGRCQPRKLKHMFLAARVPNTARKGWPVLESAGEVIWARGMPAARDFCAGEHTRLALLIEEEGIN